MAAGGDLSLGSDKTRLWALASGKGGVGKSFLTANLACLLAESDWPTVAVDLDLEGANLHTYLGVERAGDGVARALDASGDLPSQCHTHEVPGLRYIPAGSGIVPRQGMNPAALVESLRQLPERAVLLDLATGTAELALEAFVSADVPLLVITPEPASIECGYRFLRAVFLRCLMTVAGDCGEVAAVEERLRRLAGEWRPADLLRLLGRDGLRCVADVEARLSVLSIGLVVNQVRVADDLRVGFGVTAAVQQHFFMKMSYLSAVTYDPNAWLALRRRKLMCRDIDDELISEGLATLADHVVEGGELLLDQDLALHEPVWAGRAVGSSVRC